MGFHLRSSASSMIPSAIECLRKMLSSFNHQCRNSLNGIKMSLYLFKREAGGPMPRRWLELERTYQELERLFDRLQVHLSASVVDAGPIAVWPACRANACPSWASCFDARGRTFDIAPPGDDGPSDFDPMYLGLALDAFIAWRGDAGHANFETRLSWKIEDGSLEVTWTEAPSARVCLAAESHRGGVNGSRPLGQIDSLALPLLARIVSAHRGLLETSSEPEFTMRLQFPRFQNGGQSS